MKMYNKKDCEYKGGYIVCDSKVVGVNNVVVSKLNELETMVQKAKHERENKVEIKPVEPFARETERGNVIPVICTNTPMMDIKIAEAEMLMDEIDDLSKANAAQEYMDTMGPVIEFINDDFIVSLDDGYQERFDLPTIGNPLELDKDKLGEFVLSCFE